MDDKQSFINSICERVSNIDKDKLVLIYNKINKLSDLQTNLLSLITYYSNDEYGISEDDRRAYVKATEELDNYFEELLIFLATLK